MSRVVESQEDLKTNKLGCHCCDLDGETVRAMMR